uniref:BLOC-1-related complex subunit 7 n=1 Tax=Panagrolaimus sp. JU765 TaxID=591449 RepID=A0AC34RPE3_9BILA
MHIIDHDPSMAFYRLQEHVNKSVPILITRKYEIIKTNSILQGATYDIDNSIEAIKEMQKASTTFERILEMLRDSTFVKQQMDYEKSKLEQQNSSIKKKK